jgi:hypothetical protein
MDLGTMRAKAAKAVYGSAGEFAADCRLVASNCHAYNDTRHPHVTPKADAIAVGACQSLAQPLAQARWPGLGARAAEEAAAAGMTAAALNAALASVLTVVNCTAGDLSIMFALPVDTDAYPDYLGCVATPMDLGTMKGKCARRRYATVAEFKEDLSLISANCHAYNDTRLPGFSATADAVVARAKQALTKVLTTGLPEAPSPPAGGGGGSKSKKAAAAEQQEEQGGGAAGAGVAEQKKSRVSFSASALSTKDGLNAALADCVRRCVGLPSSEFFRAPVDTAECVCTTVERGTVVPR